LHWNGYGANHQTIGTHTDAFTSIGTGYHTFGLEWTATDYNFYIDGKKTWSTKSAISQTDQYMILSSELTGWGGDPASGKFPDAVSFDYVKVYKPKK
jgi:beta-glucanase (GH16 family)